MGIFVAAQVGRSVGEVANPLFDSSFLRSHADVYKRQEYTDTQVVDVLTLDPNASDEEKTRQVNSRISEIAQELSLIHIYSTMRVLWCSHSCSTSRRFCRSSFRLTANRIRKSGSANAFSRCV